MKSMLPFTCNDYFTWLQCKQTNFQYKIIRKQFVQQTNYHSLSLKLIFVAVVCRVLHKFYYECYFLSSRGWLLFSGINSSGLILFLVDNVICSNLVFLFFFPICPVCLLCFRSSVVDHSVQIRFARTRFLITKQTNCSLFTVHHHSHRWTHNQKNKNSGKSPMTFFFLYLWFV